MPIRAATLSYWSLVTIVPGLVMAAAVLTPLTPEGAQPFHEMFLRTLLAEPVRGVGDQVDAWLDAVDLGTFGVIGVIGVLYTSSRIYFAVEDAYNALWNTRPRRSWIARMVLFYTTLTAGPLLITAGFQASDLFAAETGLGSPKLLLPVLVTAAAFVTFLRMLPDTEVRWGPAVLGGLASAVAFELAKQGFGLYTRLLGSEEKAAMLYGAVWIFPVFLLWLYLLWLIVLLGVELAYVVQRRVDLVSGEERFLGGASEARRAPDALFAFQCLLVVAQGYLAGRGAVAEPEVTRRLATDPTHVRTALETLEDAGVLAESDRGYLPALPLASLTVREVLVRYRALTRPGMREDGLGADIVAGLLAPGVERLDQSVAAVVTSSG